MTFSFGVIWAAILLAPGLAAYSALFAPARGITLRPSPPAPNSLTTIGLVIGGALASHSVWLAWLTYGNAALCPSPLCVRHMAFDPNVYALALSFAQTRAPVTVGAIAYAMLHAAALTVGAYVVVRLGLRVRWVRDQTRGLLFGHLAGLVREVETVPGIAVIAFVLTKIRDGTASVGYEGTVERLSFGSDKVIGAVTLRRASKFVVKLGYSSFGRTASGASEQIDRILIERDEIENIAFNVFLSAIPSFQTTAAPWWRRARRNNLGSRT